MAVLKYLDVDPSKQIPYDSSKKEELRFYNVVPSKLGVRMYVAMELHLGLGKKSGQVVLWLLDTGSPITFISKEVS